MCHSVGGEPLVRYRELDALLPQLSQRGLYVQVVTSAVRPIPAAWASIPRLQICVSIDGLQPEHDVRRTPATYDRILKHIDGHQITVHCTVTRQQTMRDGYLEEFVRTWSANRNVKSIWLEPLHAAGRRGIRRETPARRSRPRRRDAAAAAAVIPEAADAGAADRCLSRSARIA
jgi:sulfatase maturation enzyme AslB (radical SAM superfamily)